MSMRHVFPRQGRQRQGSFSESFLARLRAECRHFHNADFRNAVTENLVNSGTLGPILCRSYKSADGREIPFGGRGGTLATRTSKGSCMGGIACTGRRVPHIEVRGECMLDVAVSLQEASPAMPHCNKVAVVFAGHPAQAPRGARGICQEEAELLGRTTWGEAFFTIESPESATSEVPNVTVSKYCDSAYIQAGTPECLIAENLWLLRHAGLSDTSPGEWRSEPRELCAICFLPETMPPLTSARGVMENEGHHPSATLQVSPTVCRRCSYADKHNRVCYHRQVEAVIKACCLLDCDGIVVGCAEGICGSEIFGHPMSEVAQVWRDVLDKTSAQFRVIVFALGKDTPMNRRCTSGYLAEQLGARTVS